MVNKNIVRHFWWNPCNMEHRSRCIKFTILILIIWVCGMYMGFFLESGLGPLQYLPIGRLHKSDLGTAAQNGSTDRKVSLNPTSATRASIDAIDLHSNNIDNRKIDLNSRSSSNNNNNNNSADELDSRHSKPKADSSSFATPSSAKSFQRMKNNAGIQVTTAASINDRTTSINDMTTSINDRTTSISNKTTSVNGENTSIDDKKSDSAIKSNSDRTIDITSNRRDDRAHDSRSDSITDSIHDDTNVTAANDSDVCTFPEVDPMEPVLKGYLSLKKKPISCQDNIPNLVYRTGETIHVNMTKVKLLEQKTNRTFVKCQYKKQGRNPKTDLGTVTLGYSPTFTTNIKLNKTDDHVKVECYDSRGHVMSRSYFAIVREKKETEDKLQENYKKHVLQNSPKETLNVLMIGIDGMSKQNFERAMPKTRNFLLENLQALELHKHNKLGDNTFPNVLPLLTGKTMEDFSNLGWKFGVPFDEMNHYFVWNEYRKAGYRTGLMLDRKWLTAFHYQKKGWLKEPVDYYMRPVVVDSDDDKLMRKPNFHCLGDTPDITQFHDYWIQLATMFNNSKTRPYFGYSFSITLTHDYQELAVSGDHLYHNFLQELHNKSLLNNTLLIFFSDHGPRFGSMRTTYHGFVEGRTPFMFLAFPPWFYKKYPHIARALKINQERLTTNFDIHATLLDLVNFQGETSLGNISDRGISLFKEIPIERTCKHNHIPTTYCLCNQLVRLSMHPAKARYLALTLYNSVVSFTEKYRKSCVRLSFQKIENVIEVYSNLTTETGKKDDGKTYQVWIYTSPGDALYEGTVSVRSTLSSAKVTGDVTRLNMYKGQAECIEDPTIRPFCFCKNATSTS